MTGLGRGRRRTPGDVFGGGFNLVGAARFTFAALAGLAFLGAFRRARLGGFSRFLLAPRPVRFVILLGTENLRIRCKLMKAG
jgi:hypothetical protein